MRHRHGTGAHPQSCKPGARILPVPQVERLPQRRVLRRVVPLLRRERFAGLLLIATARPRTEPVRRERWWASTSDARRGYLRDDGSPTRVFQRQVLEDVEQRRHGCAFGQACRPRLRFRAVHFDDPVLAAAQDERLGRQTVPADSPFSSGQWRRGKPVIARSK